MAAPTSQNASETARTSVLSYTECMRHRTASYCEENVWYTLKRAAMSGIPTRDLYAIFVSNPARAVPFQSQLHGDTKLNSMCVWDYHVLAVIISATEDGIRRPLVYDIDSTLPFPCPLDQYLNEAITKTLPNGVGYTAVQALGFGHEFRVVNYKELVEKFASDRRHMLKPTRDGENAVAGYQKPPPRRACIQASQTNNPHTLPLFLLMSDATGDGSCGDEQSPPGVLVTQVADLVQYFESETPDDRGVMSEQH